MLSLFPLKSWNYTPKFTILAHNFLTDPLNGMEVEVGKDQKPAKGPKDNKNYNHISLVYDDILGLKVYDDQLSSTQWKDKKRNPYSLDADEEKSLGTDAFIDFEQLCAGVEVDGSESSDSLYNADYSKSSFTSWNFKPHDGNAQFKPDPSKKSFKLPNGFDVFTASNSSILNKIVINSSNHNYFHSYGVIDRCIVRASAKKVMGFLICRYLKIDNRSTDLSMIGSFIVDYMRIGNIGSKNINWSTVFRQQVRSSLDTSGLINKASKCKINITSPLWRPSSDSELDRMLKCDPAILMEKAEPFKWTSFSPLCGLDSADNIVTTCKPPGRALNFNFLILNEVYGKEYE